MRLVDKAFGTYLSRISPPPSQAQAAQRSHNALRAFLERDFYFGPMIVTTFLNGSYARHTVINPIRDVDIIVVVGPDWLDAAPAKAMEALRRKLAQLYPDRRTWRLRRAVKVALSRVNLDVLMGVAPNGLDRPLQIPDRKQRRWIETDPKRQLELTEQLRARTGGNYPRLVRLLKAWAASRVAEADRPKSFALECAAFHVVSERPQGFAGALDTSFVGLLEGLHKWNFARGQRFGWGLPEIADPALPRVNVAERWGADGADQMRKKLEVALRRCEAIDRSRWEETELEKWSDLFGYPFPTSPRAVRR